MDKYKISTVGELKKLLATVPDNYELKAEYDSYKYNLAVNYGEGTTFDVSYISEEYPVLFLGLCNKNHEKPKD